MNHRGGEIGHYLFKKINECTARIICNNPYPCDFDKGLIEATALKFAAAGEYPICIHETPQICRKTDAATCSYLVSW